MPQTTQAKTIVLTWKEESTDHQGNPAWAGYRVAAAQTAQGVVVREVWSVGRFQDISVGDKAYVMKQGDGKTGIVASGTVTTKASLGPDFRNPAKQVHRIDVELDQVLNVDKHEPLDVRNMGTNHPELSISAWNAQESGRTLDPQAASVLDRLWPPHVQAERKKP